MLLRVTHHRDFEGKADAAAAMAGQYAGKAAVQHTGKAPDADGCAQANVLAAGPGDEIGVRQRLIPCVEGAPGPEMKRDGCLPDRNRWLMAVTFAVQRIYPSQRGRITIPFARQRRDLDS